MSVREDVVTSAVNFLQDPNVTSSSVESKISFLKSKNLTQVEIDTALARAGSPPVPSQAVAPPAQHSQQPYYGQYQQPPPYGWQPPPLAPPRRDWRDWFIMATVASGVSYGLYTITKRYVYPLVAPPTPEKLEQDKTTVDEQFEKAFATIEQLSKDTEALKASEVERTEKLDKLVDHLESFIHDTKSASRRQEDETDRIRDEMKTLKEVIPRNISTNKEFTDGRLREIANEVKSLKALIGQRMSSGSSAAPAPSSNGGYQRPSTSTAAPATSAAAPAAPAAPTTPAAEESGKEKETNGDAPPQSTKQDYISSLGGRSSPFASSGMPSAKASIPAWQRALAEKKVASESASEPQEEAGSSS
ncbi:peroxisomal membrane anchor protein conserved region-domain-containing protein [Truncatella angustata]|uniref:Peroxisomal membrane protein PEX14 n=1 Tax=Truncatella angustata TaxID=152316 RepID=A0A9P8RKF3_9PEZI|nr:peroxisomal membrane anchor protein conserved region-domain-containing protein [Truncatella angustata]KAH6647696.1 peroxisomal membrane anchor protein conserved region-domain-containing protein [Truncatella angustata]KAH8200618.1 hypothetical protein TruAng_005215 [Truncatella angustata]